MAGPKEHVFDFGLREIVEVKHLGRIISRTENEKADRGDEYLVEFDLGDKRKLRHWFSAAEIKAKETQCE